MFRIKSLRASRASWIVRILIPALFFVVGSGSHAQDTPTVLSQRLSKLTQELEQKRQELHIPGMAMVVVQGDRVIYSRGFGVADLEKGTAVDPRTLFAIGSSTKAFTATLIGMLVDEGKMSWDDPVTKFLPDFKLAIDSQDPDAEVTIRDLLAHRTGFTRMGVLWASGGASRQEVLRTAVSAKAFSPFRDKFYYNNVTFLAAGMASAVAAGSSWDEQVAARLFVPLGMKSSTTSIREVKDDARLSLGYRWNGESQEHERLPMRSLDNIAPAGSINSNVQDMAQWLRLQLGRGTFDGKKLLSSAQHAETWNRQIAVAPTVDYGLGWMMRSVGRHRVVEHGGNIDGFAAQVALFPDADLGFVLLTNVTATQLQGLSPRLVADALLADPVEEAESTEGDSLEIFTGKYEADFGPFKDTRFTVLVKGDRLAIDVPGQIVYELEPPNEEGKWYFSLTDQIAVSFDRNDDGSVVGLKMYQAGLTFELPREGHEPKAEIELSRLEPYLGKYRAEKDDNELEVKISKKRLAVDVPGEMVYELFLPDDEGKWFFRATDKIAVSFSEAEAGEVEAMSLYRDGDLKLELRRLAAPDPEPLPTVEEVLALGKPVDPAAWDSLRLKGRVRLIHAGVGGEMTLYSAGGRYRSDTDLGRFGWIHQAVSQDEAWTDSNLQPFQNLQGKYLTQSKVALGIGLLGDWRRLVDTVKVVGTETVGERKAYTLRLEAAELPPAEIAIDAQTGDLLRSEMTLLDPSLGVAISTVTRYEDYRDTAGVRVAFRMSSTDEWSGETVFELDGVETGVAIDESLFAPPETPGQGPNK